MGGRRIMSLKPLGLHSEAFSGEKTGRGQGKGTFYPNISDWNFLILSIHTTCIIMSYMKKFFFLLWLTWNPLCSPGWSGIHCVAQAGLEVSNPADSPS